MYRNLIHVHMHIILLETSEKEKGHCYIHVDRKDDIKSLMKVE